MIDKIKEASKKLETLVKYQDTPEHPHEYSRLDNGKLLAGVSTIADIAKSKDSGGFLAQWKVNEAIEYIKEKSETSNAYGGNFDGEGDLYYIVSEEHLKYAKYAHKAKGKEATDIGTEIHSILQKYVEQQISRKEISEIEKTDITNLFLEDFGKWETENKVEWLASELLVADLENDVAGRLDGLAIVNGKITIIDFKAANSIPPSYFIQLAGYASCLNAMGIDVEDRIIIRLPKTEKRKVWKDDIKQYKMEDNKIEFIRPPTDWSFDKEVFLHCRQIVRWLNQKSINK